MMCCLAAVECYAAPGSCRRKTADYNGYKVLRVEIRNPIGFITFWDRGSGSLKQRLKLKPGEAFSLESFEADSQNLGDTLRQQFASTQQQVKLSFAGGNIEACDEEARTLRVVYPIFTSVVPGLNPPAIEEQSSESQRPATTGATRIAKGNIVVTPVAAYNQTRGAVGGLSFSYKESKLQMTGQTEVSGNSRAGHLDLGSSMGQGKIWNNADWAGSFSYQDIPAGAASFQEGKVAGRFSASTGEISDRHIMFRYGAALEAGHQQASETQPAARLTPNSAYGSVKFYAGVTGRPRNSAFSASYGFQVGDTFLNGLPAFSKQIVDLGFNRSIPIPFRKPLRDRDDFKGPLSATVHRTLGLETRFTAGLIHNAAGAPLAERFLGGNEIRPFVSDNAWVIGSDAFIRSIPENQLGAMRGVSPGGSRFYSGNATLSFTAWGRPFLPKELAQSEAGAADSCNGNGKATFPCVLNGPFQSAATGIANFYKSRDPEYLRLTAQVPRKAGELKLKLSALSNQFSAVPSALASETAVARQLSRVRSDIASVRGALTVLAGGATPDVINQLVTSSIPKLRTDIEALTQILEDASPPVSGTAMDRAVKEIADQAEGLRAADNLPLAKFEDEAWKKLAPGHRAIDVFLHELNVYSIAPVAIFDMARVWPVNQGVRYGVGPGLRLSLVNVNFTFGYAYNPQRAPSEKSGAVFFKLDVTSLF